MEELRNFLFWRDIQKRRRRIDKNKVRDRMELPDFGWRIGQDGAGHVDVVLGQTDVSNPQRSCRRPVDKSHELRSHWQLLLLLLLLVSENDAGRRAGIIIDRLLGEVESVTGEAAVRHQSVFQCDVRHV
jgi:hypothetical protein